MPAMNFKTVVLYNERKIRPQTLEAIRNASDGEMIPVDISEMASFMPLVIHQPDLEKAQKKQLKANEG